MSRSRALQVGGFVAGAIGIIWIFASAVAFFRAAPPYVEGVQTPPCHFAPTLAPVAVGLADPPRLGPGYPEEARLLKVLGDPATSGLANWPRMFDLAPTAFDIDGDGMDEIIVQANDTKVYVFGAATGRALAVLDTGYPSDWYIERVLNAVEATSLRPGEPTSLVVTDHAACVTVWRYDPDSSSSEHFAFEKIWERRLTECFWNPSMDAKPTVADVNKDGTMEILVQTEERGFFALNADGTTRWKQCWAGGNAAPAVADLEGDGRMEAIFVSDSGFVSVFEASTGKTQWTFNAADPKYGIKPASVSVTPTIADLDGQPPKEILFTARHAPSGDSANFNDYHMAIFAVRRNLVTWQSELVWVRQPEWANPLSYTQLVAQDVDGDGATDILGMDWNTIGHSPGNWDLLGFAHAFRLDAQGKDVWVRDVDAFWSNKDLALGDVDGDGQLDLLVNGAYETQDGFWHLDAVTGEPVRFLALDGWDVTRGPLLFDLKNDGQMQLVFPVHPSDTSVPYGAILVIDLGVPYSAPWRGSA